MHTNINIHVRDKDEIQFRSTAEYLEITQNDVTIRYIMGVQRQFDFTDAMDMAVRETNCTDLEKKIEKLEIVVDKYKENIGYRALENGTEADVHELY